jgi:CMP/dCMP kinase
MIKNSPFVITISRQLGSGGGYLGQRLATRLNILYLDQEILFQAAQASNLSQIDLEFRDENVTPSWEFFLQSIGHSYLPSLTTSPGQYEPSDKTLFNATSEVIVRISQQHSAVIMGRAGSYILRNHPRHLSVLLHADIAFRQQRVQEQYHVSAQEALKRISAIDRARTNYLRVFTGQDWMNACQYHLCLDTGVIGFNKVEEIILALLQVRVGIIV